METKWLNNKTVTLKKVIKPCRLCGFCPYGQLVEEFPFSEAEETGDDSVRGDMSCEVFGHDCPVFYHAEPFAEDKKATKEEKDSMFKEMEEKWLKKKKTKKRKD